MMLGTLWNLLLPGLAAGAASLAAMQAVDEPVVAIAAAGVGAVAGALMQGREAPPPPLPPPTPPAPPPPPSTDDGLPPGLGRLLLERLPLGVLLISTRSHVLFVNPAGRQLFGRPAGVELTVAELRAPRLKDAIEHVRETREATEVEFPLQRASSLHLCAQVLPLSVEARLTAVEDQPDLLIAVEDRTRVRHAEELHRDFVANASHELKTPLAALSGLIETLLGHGRDDPEATARFLPMMAMQTVRMQRLVRDLLSLNRIELNERMRPRAPVALMRVVAEAVEALRPMAEAEGARLVCPNEDMGEPTVPGAREELAQVFANLIENAIKYGGPGNEVRVLRLDGIDERARMVGIAIEDDGPGIAREHLPRLTERFYRVSVSRSRERGGTGLGLAIVKHVLKRHRAQLEIESTLGEGSRFTVWLPLREEAKAAKMQPYEGAAE